MIGATVALLLVAPQVASTPAQRARDAFDPVRLAAAHRLHVAVGSAATLEARVREGSRALVLRETADCLALPKHKAGPQADCAKVADRELDDMARLPAALPALVAQMRTIEERAYAEHFTAADMDAISTMLESPLWQRFRSESPDVDQEVTLGLRALLRTTLDATPVPAAAPLAPAKE